MLTRACVGIQCMLPPVPVMSPRAVAVGDEATATSSISSGSGSSSNYFKVLTPTTPDASQCPVLKSVGGLRGPGGGGGGGGTGLPYQESTLL